MKKILFLLLAAVLSLTQNLQAQDSDYVTVGDETSSATVYAPVRFSYNYSYTQTLYLASELQAGDVSIINYYYNGEDTAVAPMTLYMAEVSNTMTEFANDSAFVATDDLTQVYSGTFIFQPGWNTIILDEAFSYSGDGNLVVACLSNRGYWKSKTFKATTLSGKRTIIAYSDTMVMDPETVSGTLSGRPNRIGSADVPNTVFYLGAVDDFCYGVTDIAVSEITSEGATVTWTGAETASSYILEYKASAESEWISETVTEPSYALSGLNSFTNYDVRVYSVCPSSTSFSLATTFRTALSDDSFLQLPYEQNFDDAENITLWTFNNNGTNGWYFGTAVNNTADENGDPTEGGALYISNDNGTTNAYSTSSESYSYASTLVRFPENEQSIISFDWRCRGESYSDYVRVHLLAVDYSFSATSLPYSGNLSGSLYGDTVWHTESIILPDSVAGHDYKLVFAWKNDAYGGTNPPAAIDNLKIFSTTCFSVDGLAVSASEADDAVEATVTVNDRNEGAEYFVEYRPVGATDWLSDTQPSPITLSDLAYGTQYEVRVTPNCGSETSVPSDTYTFITPCAVVSEFPTTESFESVLTVPNNPIGNDAAPLCWNNINAGYSSYYFFQSSSYSTTGSHSLGFSGAYSATSSYTFSDWMISPIYSLTGGEMVSFNLANTSTTSYYAPANVDVLICNVDEADIATAADTSRFELVTNITHQDLTTNGFMRYEVNLSEYTGNYRLALAVRNPSRSFAIDDLTIEQVPDCPAVYGASVQLASPTEAAFNFSTINGDGSGWTIAYGTAESADSFDPTAAEFTQTVEVDADFPVLIGGLEAGTTYYFAVQQNCGGAFSDVVSLSVPSVNSLPYVQDFNDPENVSEWTFSSNNTTNAWYIGTAANNPAGEGDEETETGGALYISNNGGTSNEYTGSSTTAFAYTLLNIEAAAQYKVSFDYKVNGESGYDDFSVYLVPLSESQLDNSTYSIVYNTSGQNSWAHRDVERLAADLTPGVYRLVFKWRNDGGGNYQPPVAIDNISVTASMCAPVVSITASAVGPETIDGLPSVVVDFTDANGEDVMYTLEYKASSDEEWISYSDLTRGDFPYTIPDLAFQTAYQVRVAAVCAEGNQTSYVTTSVTTPCTYVTAPWAESFDASPFSGCWERKGAALPATGSILASELSNSTKWDFSSSVSIDGVSSGRIRNNVWGTTNGWAISPLVYLEEGTTYQIAFDVAVTDYGHPENAPDPAPDDKFAMLVSIDGGATWDVANGLVFADGDEDTEHNFSDLTNTMSRYFYRLVDADENPISGLVRFAFYGGSTIGNGDNDVFVDNVSVEEFSSCPTPFALAVHATQTTATVTFNSAISGSDYEYVLIESADADPSTGTPVAVTLDELEISLENLTPETTYTFAVRSVCEGNTYSAWSESLVFTTYPVAIEVPFTCDFENEGNNGWAISNGACTNQWHVGEYTGSTSGRALYISNDNGTSAAYDVDASSMVVVEKLFQTGVSDSLAISFDLTLGGEYDFDYDDYYYDEYYEYYDYLKVFLVPADTNYSATSGASYFSDPTYGNNVIMYNSDNYDYYYDDNYVLCSLTGTQTMSVTVPNPSNELKKLVFVWKNDHSGGTQPGAIIDNISVTEVYSGEQPEPCDAPTDLAVSAITQTGATVTWNGSASSYEVRLNGGTAETVTATTKTYTELTAGTSYTVEVRSLCESNNSAWVSTTFTTLDDEVIVTPPTVATLAATNVTHNGATLNGTITAGSETITAQGFKYKTAAAADWTEVSATGTTISVSLNNLTAETAYEFKAFATTATGTVEGSVMTFTTSAAPIEVIAPTVTTLAATNVTHNAATLNGTITAGNETITAQGFRYKTAAAADWTTVNASGTTITATLTDLTAETAYEFKAFATTATGTVEGSVMTFTTAAAPIEVIAPTVTTMAATSVTSDGATLNGTIVAGNEEITAQGFIYKQDGAADWTTEQVAGENIAHTLTGLSAATTYRFKAFATTESGTVEGAEMSFTTLAGLADIESAAISATIYPNPASERATLSIDGLTETAQIVLTDVQGRVILTDTLNAGAKTYELNVKSLSSGVYYVRVIAGSTIATKKLIVE